MILTTTDSNLTNWDRLGYHSCSFWKEIFQRAHAVHEDTKIRLQYALAPKKTR